MKLTQATVDKTAAGHQVRFLRDDRLKGFGLKVSPTGAKSYVVQYRMGGRGFPSRRITIGQHGSPWSAAQARNEAERLLHLVGLGSDPRDMSNARKQEQLSELFEQYSGLFIEK